ncbi:uncharacterized protein LOC142609317 [Castanea sativa]|uniref:uncharacterized protein LOC142609317 n=1 Tax=Castanea sativa TaxID=21020 RepID=UPI003F6542A8
MTNTEWSLKFPAITITHLFSHASYHLPIILQTKIDRRTNSRSKKGFKFEEAWLLWDDCEDVVREAWSTHGDATSALCDVKEKITWCGADLYAWGAARMTPEMERMKVLQKQVELFTKSELIEATKADFVLVSKELEDLLLKQEIC